MSIHGSVGGTIEDNEIFGAGPGITAFQPETDPIVRGNIVHDE